MQLAGDAQLAEAVNGRNRTIVYRVEVDWNQNGLYNHALSNLTKDVTRLAVDRDIASSLPPETTLVEGHFGAELQLQVEGALVYALAPWRSDSSLYSISKVGIPIRAWVGHRTSVGDVTPQQFQGHITECELDSSSRSVRIRATDAPADMQTKVDLPSFALSPASMRSLGLNLQLRQNSQWVIDYVLRRNGYYMTPPPVQGCFYSATLHGSPVPELGHQTQFLIGEGWILENEDPYVDGRPGWGLAWGGSPRWNAAFIARGNFTNFAPIPGNGHVLTMQAQVEMTQASSVQPHTPYPLWAYSSGNGYLAGTSIVVLVNDQRQLRIEFYSDTTLTAVATSPARPAGWQDIWVTVKFLGPNSQVYYPGGSVTMALGLPSNPEINLYSHITTFAQLPMHDFQVFNDDPTFPANSYRYNWTLDTGFQLYTPQADLDRGLNDITGLPLRRGVPSWDLLKEVVGAEYGVIGFTEVGRPFFRNRNTVRRSTLTTVKTVTDAQALTALGMSEQLGGVRNVITGSYAPRLITGPPDDPTKWDVIWSLDDAADILIAPGATVLDLTLDEPGALVDPYVMPTQFTTAQWSDTANTQATKHGFVTCTPNGTAVTTGIAVTAIVPLSPEGGAFPLDRVRLVVNNTTSSYVQFRTTDGQAAFRLRGRKYYTGTSVRTSVERASSVFKYKERTFEIPQSDWHQLPVPLSRISLSLLKDLAVPVAVVRGIEIVGDCRLQLQDTISVEDTRGLGGPMNCQIVGLSRTLELTDTGAKLTDRLNVRPVSAPGKWILGHPVQSILGQTTRL